MKDSRLDRVSVVHASGNERRPLWGESRAQDSFLTKEWRCSCLTGWEKRREKGLCGSERWWSNWAMRRWTGYINLYECGWREEETSCYGILGFMRRDSSRLTAKVRYPERDEYRNPASTEKTEAERQTRTLDEKSTSYAARFALHIRFSGHILLYMYVSCSRCQESRIKRGVEAITIAWSRDEKKGRGAPKQIPPHGNRVNQPAGENTFLYICI